MRRQACKAYTCEQEFINAENKHRETLREHSLILESPNIDQLLDSILAPENGITTTPYREQTMCLVTLLCPTILEIVRACRPVTPYELQLAYRAEEIIEVITRVVCYK